MIDMRVDNPGILQLKPHEFGPLCIPLSSNIPHSQITSPAQPNPSLHTQHTMKLAILASLLATATAFAPAPAARASTSLSANELEIGVTAPLGVFDPLNQLVLFPEKVRSK